MLSVLTPPTSTALTTVAAARAELKLATEAHDQALARLIDDASAAIAAHLGRACARRKLREALVGSDDLVLQLAAPPIVRVTAVTHRGEAVIDVEVEDPEAGHLYREDGWEARWASTSLLTQTPIPGQGPRDWAVEYVSGWFLPGDDYGPVTTIAATAATKTLTDAAGSFPALLQPGDAIWLDSADSANVGRRTVVSATPAEIVVQEALAEELAGSAMTLRVRTLPADIERACLVTVAAWYQGQARDPDIASKRVADTTITYRGGADADAGPRHLPPRALGLLTPWVLA